MNLVLPYPPSANRYWRSIVIPSGPKCPVCGVHKGHQARVLVSKEAREYKARVETMYPKLPMLGPVKFTARAFRPQRRGDLGNLLKVTEDALQEIAFQDDNQIVELHWTRHDDKANPRIEVEITELP